MRPIKTTWVVAIMACRDQVFRVVEDVVVETTYLLSCSSPHSLCSVCVLSPYGLSLPSDVSLLVISPCWHWSGGGVRFRNSCDERGGRLLVPSFLPVNSFSSIVSKFCSCVRSCSSSIMRSLHHCQVNSMYARPRFRCNF